jgi:hypothetical protein
MTERERMGELQALVTGAIQGALMKASAEGEPFLIDVEPVTDEQGYLPEIRVTGRVSGERLRVRVERIETLDEAVVRNAPVPERFRLRPLEEDE